MSSRCPLRHTTCLAHRLQALPPCTQTSSDPYYAFQVRTTRCNSSNRAALVQAPPAGAKENCACTGGNWQLSPAHASGVNSMASFAATVLPPLAPQGLTAPATK